MGSTNAYEFISLNEQNVHHLITLYKKVFGIGYTLEKIQAKYLNNYTGIRAQGHFAFYKGKPVAFHGAIPVVMEHREEQQLSAQYGDAMTLSAHTGKGLFTKLGELTDNVLKQLGVQFVWGFPNQNSEYGYINKLHWQGENRMECYIIPLKGVPKEAVFRKTKLFAGTYHKWIKDQLKEISLGTTVVSSIDTKNYVGVCRNAEYYAYKSFTFNFSIAINNKTRVWVKPEGGLLVGDVFTENEKKIGEVVEELKKLGKRLGLSKLIIQVSPNNILSAELKKEYKPIHSWLIGYKNFCSSWPLHKLQLTYGDLDTF